jgi:pathogenesis-related protein 1
MNARAWVVVAAVACALPASLARGRATAVDAAAVVAAHNRVRAKHCAPPLAWSAEVARSAQAWASTIRDRGCTLGHSGNGKYGENLAAGTSGMLDANAVVGMWYDEREKFNFRSGGFSMKTGHFTQVVWRGTRQVGCGMSQCNGLDVWICQYSPPGNVEGQYRENVLPLGCK